MKTNKILTILFIFLSIVKADIVENKLNQVKALMQKQDILAIAVDYNILDTGTVVTNIATLKTNGYLADFVTHSGTITVNVANKEIIVTDTIPGAEQYQKDYFTNYLGRDKFASATISGDDFISTFSFSEDALKSYNLNSNYTYVQSTIPGGAVNGQTWYDTSTKIAYYYLGSWTNLNVNNLLIVRAFGELPGTANENDGAIVLTTTTLDKYLYVSGSWEPVPQSIPFTYNGSF